MNQKYQILNKSIICYFINKYLLRSGSEDSQFLDDSIRNEAISRLGSRAEAWLHSNLKTWKVMMKNQLIMLTKEFKNAMYLTMQQNYQLNPPIAQRNVLLAWREQRIGQLLVDWAYTDALVEVCTILFIILYGLIPLRMPTAQFSWGRSTISQL